MRVRTGMLGGLLLGCGGLFLAAAGSLAAVRLIVDGAPAGVLLGLLATLGASAAFAGCALVIAAVLAAVRLRRARR
ncbi:MAG: hypothetical protein A2V85_07380 [Chloroflexi bacterium RBG_16_72_14]|nr:MAG: hypothetical protein A2V85_07380 [Chloroflexi bacterium RBG_16_72_14]